MSAHRLILSVSNEIDNGREWTRAKDGSGLQIATVADLRAVAAYLQALAEDPIETEVQIGHLHLKLEVDRCPTCAGKGQRWVGAVARSWETCPSCNGSGRWLQPAPAGPVAGEFAPKGPGDPPGGGP